MTNKIIVSVCFTFISLTGFSQDGADLRKGDVAMAKHAYAKAYEFYKTAAADSKIKVIASERLAKAYMASGDHKNAEVIYNQLSYITPEGAFDRFEYAQVLRMNGKYEEADHAYQAYFKAHPNDPLAAEFSSFLSKATKLLTDTDQYNIIDIPENTSGSEVGPTFCFYFLCYSSDKNGDPNAPKDNYDLYMQRAGNPANPPVTEKLQGKINRGLTEGPATFSRDGKEMIFTRSNYKQKSIDCSIKTGLYHADYDTVTKQWTNITVLNFIDYNFDYMQPSLSKDGSMLFFASDMAGGLGGTDIYVSYRQGSTWSTPVNLGCGINTPGKEETPYIADDGTLYFASDSRMGLGGLDIYQATFTDGVWGHAVNPGAPLNSAYDDFGYINDQRDHSGYFVSDRPGGKGGNDIYHFSLIAPKH